MPGCRVHPILRRGLVPEKGKFLAYVVGIDGISSNRTEERQQKGLEDAQGAALNMDAIKSLYPKIVDRINRATFEDKRFVLECLDAEVTLGPSGVTLSLAVPEKAIYAVSNPPGRAGGNINVTFAGRKPWHEG